MVSAGAARNREDLNKSTKRCRIIAEAFFLSSSLKNVVCESAQGSEANA